MKLKIIKTKNLTVDSRQICQLPFAWCQLILSRISRGIDNPKHGAYDQFPVTDLMHLILV